MKKTHILIVGEYYSGKTTLLLQLKLGDLLETDHKLLHVQLTGNEKLEIFSWDTSPNKKRKEEVEPYYEKTDMIIFMVNSSEPDLIKDSQDQLWDLLKEESLKKCPLLVFANFQDKESSLTTEKISEILKLAEIEDRQWLIQGCSTLTGEGVKEGFDWLSQYNNK
jgi:signal recognition particle receptor subunit beta